MFLPWPNGWTRSAGRSASRIPRKRSAWFPVSAIEWKHSTSIAALPVTAAPTPFRTASDPLPTRAAATAVLDSATPLASRPGPPGRHASKLGVVDAADANLDRRPRATPRRRQGGFAGGGQIEPIAQLWRGQTNELDQLGRLDGQRHQQHTGDENRHARHARRQSQHSGHRTTRCSSTTMLRPPRCSRSSASRHRRTCRERQANP